jgi:hypothetical protein
MLIRWNRRMYSTICKNQNAIINAIPQKDVLEYESLLQQIGQANTSPYQTKHSTLTPRDSMGRKPSNSHSLLSCATCSSRNSRFTMSGLPAFFCFRTLRPNGRCGKG